MISAIRLPVIGKIIRRGIAYVNLKAIEADFFKKTEGTKNDGRFTFTRTLAIPEKVGIYTLPKGSKMVFRDVKDLYWPKVGGLRTRDFHLEKVVLGGSSTIYTEDTTYYKEYEQQERIKDGSLGALTLEEGTTMLFAPYEERGSLFPPLTQLKGIKTNNPLTIDLCTYDAGLIELIIYPGFNFNVADGVLSSGKTHNIFWKELFGDYGEKDHFIPCKGGTRIKRVSTYDMFPGQLKELTLAEDWYTFSAGQTIILNGFNIDKITLK